MSAQLLFDSAAGFEAARTTLRGPHGHSFAARLRVRLPAGWASFAGGEVEDLRARLTATVAPLDYRHLNEEIDDPSDENIARWIAARLQIDGVYGLGVRSAPRQGVDLDAGGQAFLWRRYAFESAHRLPRVPVGHKCGRMHGHGFEAVLHVKAASGSNYGSLDTAWAPVGAQLNYACLNDIAGLENPTSEMLSSWIFFALKPALPELSSVAVFETASCGSHFDGTRYRIWKEFSFDSSTRFAAAPAHDGRSHLHGHTYTLRLHLNAALDQALGWMLDFGDIKELFKPIVRELDHRPLHEIVQPDDPSLATLLHWIRARSTIALPQLDRIDLHQTAGCGALLHWGTAAPIFAI